MKTFHVVCVVLGIVAVRSQQIPTGLGSRDGTSLAGIYQKADLTGSVPTGSRTAIRPAAVYAAPISSRISAAPAAYSAPAAPVNVGVIAAGRSPTVRTHEIHTSSGNQTIRIEDFQAGDQVIRVHEGPQGGPQVAQVQVPGEQHHVRVINHASGRAHVERVVSRAPTQVIDVQKPGRPGARIIQVVKGRSAAPRIEFVQDGGSAHEIYYADDAGSAGGIVSGGSLGGGVINGGGLIRGGYLIGGGQSTVLAAPAVTVANAAPAVAYGSGPGLSNGISYGTVGGYALGSDISYGTELGLGHIYSHGVEYGSPAIYSSSKAKSS